MRLGRLVFSIIGSLAAVSVLGALALLFELSYRPTYDQADPNYRRYLEVFDRLRPDLDYRGATRDDYIDLSELNNGEWKTACLFGGYTDPLKTIQMLGANIDEKDRARMTEAGSRSLRIGQVEEQEMAIAFVDLRNNARFIHFRTGIGPEGQHLQKCISKPQTMLYLAVP
jgi:hypothetical protein